MADLLDQLWMEVINLECDGANGWRARVQEEGSFGGKLGSTASEVLAKIPREAGENLMRLSRLVRYEACFGTMYSMSDPGTGKTAGLARKFEAQQNGGAKNAFFKSLWELVADDGDGEWLKDLPKKKSNDESFGDAGPAVSALLKSGIAARQLDRLCAWHRFDACRETLRLIEESGIATAEEADGLYESLLGADPSGLEGRPGSWPIKTKKRSARSADEPLYKLRAVQACAFSNDSKTLAVAGASGPVRLLDPATGEERRICEGIKAHIYRIAFSPDDKQVAAGKIHKDITVCDAKFGKLISSCKRTNDEISALVYASNGDLLCSSWCNEIVVFDGKTGKKLESLRAFEGDGMVNDMEFSPDGRQLLMHWQTQEEEKCNVTVWSWPARKELLNIKVGEGYCQAVCWLKKGREFAVCDKDTGITIYDRASGKKLCRFGDADTEMLAVTPGEHIIATGAEDKLCIWNSSTRKRVRELSFSAMEAAVPPDGKYLMAANVGAGAVWRLSALI